MTKNTKSTKNTKNTKALKGQDYVKAILDKSRATAIAYADEVSPTWGPQVNLYNGVDATQTWEWNTILTILGAALGYKSNKWATAVQVKRNHDHIINTADKVIVGRFNENTQNYSYIELFNEENIATNGSRVEVSPKITAPRAKSVKVSPKVTAPVETKVAVSPKIEAPKAETVKVEPKVSVSDTKLYKVQLNNGMVLEATDIRSIKAMMRQAAELGWN